MDFYQQTIKDLINSDQKETTLISRLNDIGVKVRITVEEEWRWEDGLDRKDEIKDLRNL